MYITCSKHTKSFSYVCLPSLGEHWALVPLVSTILQLMSSGQAKSSWAGERHCISKTQISNAGCTWSYSLEKVSPGLRFIC